MGTLSMRGRKPASPKVQDLAAGILRVVDGGAGATNGGELPAPDTDVPPSWMTDPHAIAEWRRVIPELQLRKQYIRLFETEVARYCVAFGHYVAAVQAMEAAGGPVVKASTGTDMLSQHWIVASRAHEIMAKLAADLGLNPVAQVRMAGLQLDMFDAPPRRYGTDGTPANPFGQFRR
jgi:P27 family predicted phage terminase small subunit